jgi:glycosyltransferase involved in cell wall biosynthesis
VYGKTVLDGKNLQDYNPPGNINTKGVYSDLGEVLKVPYTGFLYTSQWDGIPTILLDVGATGLPIAAPKVGGVSELLDSESGWLIEDFTDVEAYSAALAEIAANADEVERRTAQMRMKIAQKFSKSQYLNAIKETFERHGI